MIGLPTKNNFLNWSWDFYKTNLLKEVTLGHDIEITWLEWLFQHRPINIVNESNFRFNLDGNWWNPITSLHAYEWCYINWWCVTTVWRDERCDSKIDRDGNAACKTKWRAKFETVGWRRSRGRLFFPFNDIWRRASTGGEAAAAASFSHIIISPRPVSRPTYNMKMHLMFFFS